MDAVGIGSFYACLDISIFFLRKGVEDKMSALFPHDAPSYSFIITSDGIEQWTDESVWETIHT